MRVLSTSARRRVLAYVAALAVAALALTGCSGADEGPAPSQLPGQGYQSGDGSVRVWAVAERGDALNLTGTDYTEKPVDISAWRGDVVLINTWFAACPPCRVEAPVLAAISTDRGSEGVHVIGINRVDDAGAALAFERTHDIPYPSINDRSGEATASLQGVVPIAATPTTVVLDRQGRVAARVLGVLDATTINAIIDDVLAET